MSEPPETLSRLWYDLTEIDQQIAYVQRRLRDRTALRSERARKDSTFRDRHSKIRALRRALLRNLNSRREARVLRALHEESARHRETLVLMLKLLTPPDYPTPRKGNPPAPQAPPSHADVAWCEKDYLTQPFARAPSTCSPSSPSCRSLTSCRSSSS
jgi:hypothetical protein